MATALRTTVVLELAEVRCCSCDVLFAMPATLHERRRADGEKFWCPNGHPNVYGETEATKLRKRVERLEALKTHLTDQRDAERRARESAEKAAAAQRGENTKLRKRVANGVCPCCHRQFANLHRHMAGQHPDYAGAQREAAPTP